MLRIFSKSPQIQETYVITLDTIEHVLGLHERRDMTAQEKRQALRDAKERVQSIEWQVEPSYRKPCLKLGEQMQKLAALDNQGLAGPIMSLINLAYAWRQYRQHKGTAVRGEKPQALDKLKELVSDADMIAEGLEYKVEVDHG